jgi:4-hydroxy-2-oxoheptanedioate aldolase
MRVNTTKAKLAEGRVVIGGIVSGFSPEIVELLGLLEFDFVFLDCEHGSMTVDQVEHMVRAAEVTGITPIARIPNHDDSTILRFLDRGVQGLIIPHINTAEQAAAVAAASRYHPQGHRGSASGRAHDYGVRVPRPESMAFINDNVLVIPMCEEVEAVKNLDSILAVPGIDVVHVASGDLGQSMGHPPAAEVRAAMADVVRRTRAAGRWAGIGGNGVTDYSGIADLVRDGAQFVTIPALGLLRQGAETFKRGVAAALATK